MLLTGTKKSFSALEVQRQLGHLYYESIWYMFHKTRYAMGKRDANYQLHDQIELDGGFFEIIRNKEDRERIAQEIENNNENLKRGKGSQKQVSVLEESKPVAPSDKYKHKTSKKVGFIKMKILKKTTNQQVKDNIDTKVSATTDGANNYNDIKNHLDDH